MRTSGKAPLAAPMASCARRCATGIRSATHRTPRKTLLPDWTFLGWHWLRQCLRGIAAAAHWRSQCHPDKSPDRVRLFSDSQLTVPVECTPNSALSNRTPEPNRTEEASVVVIPQPQRARRRRGPGTTG